MVADFSGMGDQPGNTLITVLADRWICRGTYSFSPDHFVAALNRPLLSTEGLQIWEVDGPGWVHLEPKPTQFGRLCEVPMVTVSGRINRTGTLFRGSGRVTCSHTPRDTPFPWTWTVIALFPTGGKPPVILCPPFDINASRRAPGTSGSVSNCQSKYPSPA